MSVSAPLVRSLAALASLSLFGRALVERLGRTHLLAAAGKAGLGRRARGLPPPPAPPTEAYRDTAADRADNRADRRTRPNGESERSE